MRFGISMNIDHTPEGVGRQFSVMNERIREIEAKALRKLKHPSRSRKPRSFLDNWRTSKTEFSSVFPDRVRRSRIARSGHYRQVNEPRYALPPHPPGQPV